MFEIENSSGGDVSARFTDKDGDECYLDFYDIEGGLVALSLASPTGAAIFTREQAVAIANLILERTAFHRASLSKIWPAYGN